MHANFLICFDGDRVSIQSTGCFETHYGDQASLELIEIYLPLAAEC